MTKETPKASYDGGFEWNRGDPLRRCVATSNRSGKRCRNWAIRGGSVCRYHGGSTEHVKRSARERIDRAQDLVAMRMIGFAVDEGVPPHVAIAAAKDILDRGGLKPPQGFVNSEPALWETLMADIMQPEVHLTRAQHCAIEAIKRGEPIPAALSRSREDDREIVDVEIVPEQSIPTPRATVGDADRYERPTGAADKTAPSSAPPPQRMLTQDEAADSMRESRLRMRTTRKVRSHRPN